MLTLSGLRKRYGEVYGLLRGRALAERVDWALDFAALSDRRKDRAATFSGGMKRPLNLAAALVHDPRLLLLDEPTAGVDPQSRNAILEKVLELRRLGRTVVYTTHYMLLPCAVLAAVGLAGFAVGARLFGRE